MSNLEFPYCDKHHDKKKLGEGKDYSSYHSQVTITGGKLGQELRQEPQVKD